MRWSQHGLSFHGKCKQFETGNSILLFFLYFWVSLVAHMVRNSLAMQETQIWSLGWEDPLEKGMATHSSILAWRIPWIEELVGYSPWGCWVRHNWTNTSYLAYNYTPKSEKAMAPHSSTLAWKIPWVEEPGGLQSMGLQIIRHDWVTSLSLFPFMHWRRKWQPTPVFLPGDSQGWGSLVGCPSMGSHRVGHDWNDLAYS